MTIDTNKDPLNLGEIFSGLFEAHLISKRISVKNLNFEDTDNRCSRFFTVHRTILSFII